jgi:hypothetical protein
MPWEYLMTTNYREAIDKAVELGWREKQVQVRVEFRDTVAHYFIEPWEKDCACPHILRYADHGP